MFIKLNRVATRHKELPPINLHEPSMRWSSEVTWQIKYIAFPPAETHGHQTLQIAHLQQQALILKVTRTLDHVTKVMSGNNLKILHIQYHKSYGQ